jgi:DNA-binding beta-propeller fold protein YncE
VNSSFANRKHFVFRILPAVALSLGLTGSLARAQNTNGAAFGEVITLGGTPSDIVLDELRHVIYLVSNNTNRVDIYDYQAKKVTGSIAVGTTPLAAAMSMDSKFLYVTNNGNAALSVIDLSIGQVIQTVLLPSRPEGVEVGADGRVLISMIGTGVVQGTPQGTLAVFDRTLVAGQQLLTVTVPALPSTPAPLTPTTLPRPQTTFRGKLLRTPDGQYIVGVITPTNGTTYIFVYEVSSGVVLRNRTTSGQSTVLSMAPDGSRFMAGMAMYDTATLAQIAQQSNANAPFTFSSAFNTLQNVGGSAFSPDGATIYSAFNTAANASPAPRPQSSTLLVGDPTNLGIRLGIKLPESIVAKLVMTSDGAQAWGMSESGLLSLPLGRLYEYPIIAPETTQVFLAVDECNRGIASGTLKMSNLGKGRLSYAVFNNTGNSVVFSQSSGLAPSTVTFTMEPGRSGILRRPGTNIWTGAGTFQGTALNVTISTADAINLPNTLRLYMNYRQADQRGQIFPIPTTPNGSEGLQDIVLDEKRNRVYITNSGYNRIEVFDTRRQKFLDPIRVGQLPHQMAMTSDGNTLYVGNTGGESISIVDLSLGRTVDSVVFPPIPRNGTANPVFPRTLAVSQFGLQFIMSNGTQWKVVGNNATVRPASTVIPTTLGNPVNMLASPGNEYILTLAGNGQGFLYDSGVDTYVSSRQLFNSPGNPIQGYFGVLGAGPKGAYYLANGLIMNPSLTVIGGSERPGATGFQFTQPGQPPAQVVVNTGQRNVAAVAPITDTIFIRMTTPVRQNITAVTRDDERTTLEAVNLVTGEEVLAGVAPENPIQNVFNTQRINVVPRWMAVDSRGTVYAITLSGLSVIPLTAPGTDTRPAVTNGVRGIVNSTDGTTNIRPGSFITVSGRNLAAAATAETIPPPTVLGGSCVTFGDIAVPLIAASGGQIQAQVPESLRAGTHVVQVRSLATAQASDPIQVSVRASGTGTGGTEPGTPSTEPGPGEEPGGAPPQ